VTPSKWIGTIFVAAAFSISVLTAWTAPQDQQQNSPYSSAEFSAYKAARAEYHPPKKLALLDSFVAEYPDSTLLASVFYEYSTTYLIVGNYRESIEYIDKFIAELDKIDPETLPEGMFGHAQRLDGLYLRTQAYLEGGCADKAFQTPEAYKQAKAAATEGLSKLGEWNERPRNMKDYEFEYLKKQAGVLFTAAAEVAQSEITGTDPANVCKAPGSKFNHILTDIQSSDNGPQIR
jgi:tetratricopeptide (TPR) repeat protein